MKITIYETVREYVEVEVEDGLEGQELEAAVEEARCSGEGKRGLIDVTEVSWEIEE